MIAAAQERDTTGRSAIARELFPDFVGRFRNDADHFLLITAHAAHHITSHHSTAQHSTEQYSVTQRNTAQHITAHHSTAH